MEVRHHRHQEVVLVAMEEVPDPVEEVTDPMATEGKMVNKADRAKRL